ncbi:MAG: chromosome segregation protein SMC, partial [Rhodanobacter sp.]|nr:chromosome segregation protein SMC [Rhodanobacter sp.]
MRLTTIKLAGFKSFVDPTTLHLPTNMTGVVGPNGCGKSNIIDAIRWVMGESAASRLRGDALVDVIFSGSTGRKPVGSAMVELLFDNSDGLIAGEYASYNEISVKRVVSRDGQSQYFLNGVRCRRRDITDLFLGTGLGPRSYSVVEQGMISEIVEADPEQLRNHLEEAAGISKYKERRKETENRIRATRENLDRVRDVRDEVDKQLEHLKRQARTAERWQALKEEHKKKEAQVKALNLRALQIGLDGYAAELRKAELAAEQQLAQQRHCEAALETGREKHASASEHMNAVQAEVYRVGAQIARIEQQIQHTKELAERRERERQEADRAHAELTEHIEADCRRLEELGGLLGDAAPRLAALRTADEEASEALRGAEAKIGEWQTTWDAHARETSQATQAAEVERTNLNHLDKQCLQADQRLHALEAERGAANIDELGQALGALDAEHATLRGQVEVHTAALEERRHTAEAALEAERATQAALSAQRGALENLRGRLGSLEALQHAALTQGDGAAKTWLERLGLADARRLGEALRVEAGWERAVETVLDGWLEAVLIDDPHAAATDLPTLGEADLVLINAAAASFDVPADSLAMKAQGPAVARALLARVRACASLDTARSIAATLSTGQSVVTPEGEWLGAGYVRVRRGAGAQVGVIAREREIRELAQRIGEVEREIGEHAQALERGKQARIEAERLRDDAQRDLYVAHRRLAEVAGQLQSQRGRIDSAHERLTRVAHEIAEVTARLDIDHEQVRQARGRLDTAVSHMGDLEQHRQQLESARRAL